MDQPGILENRLKTQIEAGRLALCMALRQARTADIAPIVAASGFDSLYIDMEHSPISQETVSMLCIAALGFGVTPLVRIPGHSGELLSRALDGGAQGVIVPHVDTPEQARAMASHGKYPPLGHRSVMGAGPAAAYRNLPLGQITVQSNEQTLLVAMLETPQGIANADAIAAVEGIDMLLIGSNDLCTEMGIPGQLRHPDVLAAYRTAAEACRRHGKALGIGGIRGDLELQSQLFALGARFIIAGSDVTYLAGAALKDAQALRAAHAGAQS